MTGKKWFEYIVIGLFVAICIFSFSGNIHFGFGLGDITYVLISGLAAFTYLYVLLLIRKEKRIYFLIARLIFGLILLYLMYACTFGRGAESSWDGTIFF